MNDYNLINENCLVVEKKESKMTVIVAAICENGKYAVIAADEMITFLSPLNIQFEPPNLCKIISFKDTSVIAFSGTVPDGETVITKAKALMPTDSQQQSSINAIGEIIRKAFAEERKNKIEQTVLFPLLGANFEQYQKLVKESSSSQILQQILMVIQQRLQSEQLDFLLVGVDNTGAHIFNISMPGILQPADTLGFSAVGTGAIHAAIYLTMQKYTKEFSFTKCIQTVYKAKKAAEVAPGVGKEIDIVVITDKIYKLTKEDLTIIGKRPSQAGLEELCEKWLPTNAQ